MPTLLHVGGAGWDEIVLLAVTLLAAMALTWMWVGSRGR